jgi:hypothetical protein
MLGGDALRRFCHPSCGGVIMRVYRFFSLCFFSLRCVWLGLALSPSLAIGGASAQVALRGNYVDYFGVGATGTFINSASQSMRYTDDGLEPYSCDTFSPGTPSEGFTVEAMGAVRIDATNDQLGTDIPTTAMTTLGGRAITWTGREENGTTAITIEQQVTYGFTDHLVAVNITLTNSGTVALTDVYYLRTGDPDFAACSIGTTYNTANDVVQQPPAFGSALIVSTAGGLTLGLGAADPRARVSVGSGLVTTDASGIWSGPLDPEGAAADAAIAIVFREPMLAAGASTSFTFFYVWGTSPVSVQARFDTVTGTACVGEGTACTAGERTGTCRSERCCLGCWDGTLCQVGGELTVCGAGGSLCEACKIDETACTSEYCIEGSCEVASADVACDDGLFCTENDHCMDGACGGSLRACDDADLCTLDSCDEGSRRCVFGRTASCTIDGMCVADGNTNPANPCEICDTDRSAGRWSPVAAGTGCGTGEVCEGGVLSSGSSCNAAGACVPNAGTACPSGECASATECRPGPASEGGAPRDAGPPGPPSDDGGCCSTTGMRPAARLVATLVVLLAVGRRRRR